jgi:predicted enzyme related to lactoylglutathione lyase
MTETRPVLVLDCADPDALSAFWAAALGYRLHGSDGHYAVLLPSDGEGFELVLQRVPEPKTAKNRMHLDLRVADLDAEVDRLRALGARTVGPGVFEEDGYRWTVLEDPQGNEFCVCVEPSRTVP